MKLVLAALTASTLMFCSFCAAAAVDEKFDRFTQETKITYIADGQLANPGRGKNALLFSAHATASAGDPPEFKSASIILAHVGKGWHYLRCHTVHWLIDGTPRPMEKTTHFGDVHRGAITSEKVVQPLSREDLHALATASTVEVKLCNDEMKLSAEMLRNLVDVASRAGALVRLPEAQP